MGFGFRTDGSPVRIPPGKYWIGDDSIPNSGPRHVVAFEQPIWIDRHPVRLTDIERVVVSGRLKPGGHWSDSKSIDESFLAMVEKTRCSFVGFQKRRRALSSLPVIGLLWQEAVDICAAFGARLPTEAEWEVAMGSARSAPSPSELDALEGVTSDLGCVGFPGLFQEWTWSEWTDRYWTDDAGREAPGADARICVRGRLPVGQVASIQCRIAAARDDMTEPRVFRRVWDRRPAFASS